MSAIFRALLIGLLAATCGSASISAAFGKTRPQQAAEEAAKRRPMTFFLAKGAVGACGEGCSEWIAAEGVFDAGSGKRFEIFLGDLKRNELPVFFNSPGGSVSQSVKIGGILRARRMTVGIGRTRPEGCEPGTPEDACHRVMQSSPEHKARLIIAGARCYSACAYAFIGGSTRKIGRGARIGVHSAFTGAGVPEQVQGRSVIENAHAALRRYSLAVGVDSGLIDLAAKTRPERMHRLSAEEIARFGIETTEFFETRWIPVRESSQRFILQKSVTQRMSASPAEHLTSVIQIGCVIGANAPVGSSYVAYRRELPLTGAKVSTAVRATFGDYAVPFARRQTKNSIETGFAPARSAVLDQAAVVRDIVVTEIVLSANGTQADTRELKLSTAGLTESLAELRKRCDGTNLIQEAAPPSRWPGSKRPR